MRPKSDRICYILLGYPKTKIAMSKPEIPQKFPYVETLAPGTYAWCSCGKSTNQPYCDGSHKGSGFVPIVEKLETEKKVAWCGCKSSGNPPFCDGSHSKL